MGKKLQPKLRFRGFTDAWEQRKLGSLGTSYSGLSGKDKTDFGHGFGSYITYLNVFQNPIADIDGTDRIEIDPKQNTVHYGDVFFTVSSETPEEVGMSSVWLGNQQNIYLNSFCFGYRQKGTFDIKYLAYMLRSRSIRNRMKILAQGISRFNISQRRVMDIEVSFPSMDEQQKIGVLCGKLDQLIAAEKRKLDLLKDKKTALLRQIFDQKERFKGYTDPWEQRKLGDILSYEQPYEYIVSSDDYSPVARTPVLTAGKTLILGYTNEADGIKAVTKDSPVIIFDDFTASSHIIDYSFKIKSSAMKILSLRDSENDLYCIYYALTRIIRPSASHERQWISKYARATVTIPSKDEQQVIGDFLRKLDRLIAAESRKIDLLELKKKALLQQMFV